MDFYFKQIELDILVLSVMYLKISKKISPLRIAQILFPDQPIEDFFYDYENHYEWVILPIPQYKVSLNISRDHGLAEYEDEILDSMSEYELEHIESAGLTYICNDKRDKKIPTQLIQEIVNKLGMPVELYNQQINIDHNDGVPDQIIQPVGL